jgi:hypothetical protein
MESKNKNIKGDVFTASSFSLLQKDIPKYSLDDLVKHIEDILKNIFVDPHKQEVGVYHNRLNFSCPYCLDSDNFKKQRGNIYLDSMQYHCFVCGKHTSVSKFIKHFKENLSTSELLAIQNLQNNSTNHYIYGECDVFDNNLLSKYLLPREQVEKLYEFENIKGTKGEKYLKARFQKNLKIFSYDSKMDAIVIYNLSKDDKVLGFVLRLLEPKLKNKYLSYKLSTIYKKLEKELPEEAEYLDRISLIFNILNLNYNGNITVFEGPFDSFLYTNSLALGGVAKNLPFSSEYIRYWLDNDDIGKQYSKELLGDGKKIFLWGKYLKDNNIPTYVKIKDLTDLIFYSKKNRKRLSSFENYFSNSKLDLFFL